MAENLATIVERLRGIVRIPVNDGCGPLDGSDVFERHFPTSRLALEAATRIEELEAQIAARPAPAEAAPGWENLPLERVRDQLAQIASRAHNAMALLSAAPTPPAQPVEGWSQALADIAAERRRQVEAEGWTPEHDDEHGDGQMAAAAGVYAKFAFYGPNAWISPPGWPWSAAWWKPKDARSNLIKAGALIAAEIERLDRVTPASRDGAEIDARNKGDLP